MSAKIVFIGLFSTCLFSFKLNDGIREKEISNIDFSRNPNGKEKVLPIDESKEDQMILLINKLRTSKGLNPLIKDKDLTTAARYHAADMCIEDYFEHNTHNRKRNNLMNGLGTFDRIRLFYNKGFANSENIAAGNTDPEDAFNQWLHSQGHYENMMNEESNRIGIGYYESEDSEWGGYWVMDTSIE